jgi:hypothetical protein
MSTNSESDKKIVSFRSPEVTPEDRVRGLQAEVERLARQQPVEWVILERSDMPDTPHRCVPISGGCAVVPAQ